VAILGVLHQGPYDGACKVNFHPSWPSLRAPSSAGFEHVLGTPSALCGRRITPKKHGRVDRFSENLAFERCKFFLDSAKRRLSRTVEFGSSQTIVAQVVSTILR